MYPSHAPGGGRICLLGCFCPVLSLWYVCISNLFKLDTMVEMRTGTVRSHWRVHPSHSEPITDTDFHGAFTLRDVYHK